MVEPWLTVIKENYCPNFNLFLVANRNGFILTLVLNDPMTKKEVRENLSLTDFLDTPDILEQATQRLVLQLLLDIGCEVSGTSAKSSFALEKLNEILQVPQSVLDAIANAKIHN